MSTKGDDFYMILPSNASPDTHPNNKASDFIVAWENPIELDTSSKWKVALTELSYIYQPSTISSAYRIIYIKNDTRNVQSMNSISFPEDRKFDTVTELVDFMNAHCKDVFEEVIFNPKSSRISLNCKSNVIRFDMYYGLNYVLGFQKTIYRARSGIPLSVTGDFEPQLNRGIVNMYIYASICRPIYVGHTQVPLLKNVFIDSSKDSNDEGHARNYIVYNPMYIPVASNSFNSIEINIRNDAGNTIVFPQGALTMLTLHFSRL
jgi:hypothetical protein